MIEIRIHWLAFALGGLASACTLFAVMAWLFLRWVRLSYFPITHCAGCGQLLIQDLSTAGPAIWIVQHRHAPELAVLCWRCARLQLGPPRPIEERQIDAEFEPEPAG